MQDAFAAAVQRWPIDGVPDKPGAWLATAARNRAIDRIRSAAIAREKLRDIAMLETETPEDAVDERLALIFTCCHPILPLSGRVALTLRTVAGLTVPEIASAFLVSDSTMAQRLVRARSTIAREKIPYGVPPPDELGDRLDGVLAVIYLVFNEGYTSSRTDLVDTAIDLGEAVVELMPSESEARGLLALMLLHNSRRLARVGPDGATVTLEEQDRSLWDVIAIRRGLAILATASGTGSYALQALIASVHARARSAATTDWASIVARYDDLLELAPSPIVALNRAIAVGMASGPDAGLALLNDLSPALGNYRLLPAAQADLLVRAGRVSEAVERYREAIALAVTASDRADLQRRLDTLEGSGR